MTTRIPDDATVQRRAGRGEGETKDERDSTALLPHNFSLRISQLLNGRSDCGSQNRAREKGPLREAVQGNGHAIPHDLNSRSAFALPGCDINVCSPSTAFFTTPFPQFAPVQFPFSPFRIPHGATARHVPPGFAGFSRRASSSLMPSMNQTAKVPSISC